MIIRSKDIYLQNERRVYLGVWFHELTGHDELWHVVKALAACGADGDCIEGGECPDHGTYVRALFVRWDG